MARPWLRLREMGGDRLLAPESRRRITEDISARSTPMPIDPKVDEQSERSALLAALTTEHFVLQTANNSTYAEASARSMLYVMVLSSSLVATGFVAASTEVLVPFVAIVLPAVFLLGLFTVVRLVETALESMHCLDGIARIRAHYRTLGPTAARYFSPERGRWPETQPPSLHLGPALAFFGTTASMIAVINNVVAGVGVALFAHFLSPALMPWVHALAGIVGALVLTWAFYAYQRWRFNEYNFQAGGWVIGEHDIQAGQRAEGQAVRHS